MSFDFGAVLSDDQKRALLGQRIAQFAAEGYQHSLNKQVAAASGNDDAVAQADEAMEILGKAIEVHQTELAALPIAEPTVE